MTLSVFIDIWTRNKHIVYLCSDKYYDDMFDLIDEINDGEKKIEEISEYLICTFIPSCSQFVTAYYLQGKLADAEVEHFYIGDGYMIVWIEESEEVVDRGKRGSMTREEAISEWLNIHCPKCANNDDRGTDFLNCQAECEVQKDIGIACIHYEEAHDIKPQEGEDNEDIPMEYFESGGV